MREILFRGKALCDDEWIEGSLVINEVDTSQRRYKTYRIWNCTYGFEDEDGYEPDYMCGIDEGIDPDTVGQYTGLKDKNGKRIFEGDIIKIPDNYDEFGMNAGEVYQIYFCCGGFRLKPKYSQARGYWLEDDNTVEIIGNIHDNPELIGGNDETNRC